MIDKLFTYTGDVEQFGDLGVQYDKCTLVTQIGDHKVGSLFHSIEIDYANGKLTLWELLGEGATNFGEDVELLFGGSAVRKHEFNLRLKVAPNA